MANLSVEVGATPVNVATEASLTQDTWYVIQNRSAYALHIEEAAAVPVPGTTNKDFVVPKDGTFEINYDGTTGIYLWYTGVTDSYTVHVPIAGT